MFLNFIFVKFIFSNCATDIPHLIVKQFNCDSIFPFLQVSCYQTNISLLLEKAQQTASIQPERITKLKVCIFKEDYHHSVAHRVQEQEESFGKNSNKHR